MFVLTLSQLVPAALLSSDRLLQQDLQRLCLIEPPFESNVEQRVLRDYQHYTQAPLRNEDIACALHFCGSTKNLISLLSNLAKEYLHWQGACVEVKYDRLNDWLSLCSLVDPAWVVAAFYHDLLNQNLIQPNEITTLIKHYQCPVALAKPTSFQQYADNHVHMGGHGTSHLSMVDLLIQQINPRKKIKWSIRQESTLFESDHYSKDQLIALLRCLVQYAIHHFPTPEINTEEAKRADFIHHLHQILNGFHVNTSPISSKLNQYSDYIDQALNGESNNDWILLCFALLHHQAQLKDFPPTVLHAIIRSSHILRNYMIVSGVGLGQFVEFYGLGIRNKDKDANLQYDQHQNILREFRATTGTFLKKKKKKGYLIVFNRLEKFVKQLITTEATENHHLVIHFTRGFPKQKESNQHSRHYAAFRHDLYLQVNKVRDLMSSLHAADYQISTTDPDTRYQLNFTRLIRGFDVAGNENELPVEVFAPALRALRCWKIAPPVVSLRSTYRNPLPFLTIHVGEDFNHLLTGLRAIDEAVCFCDYQPGDRIGHGLALGVDVFNWAHQQGSCYVPLSQHLDNLVWCYHHAIDISQVNSHFIAILALLEKKIQHWIGVYYQNHTDLTKITPYTLYQAWSLRRNCPTAYQLHQGSRFYKDSSWLPDMNYLNREMDTAIQLWQEYLNPDIEHVSSQEYIVKIDFIDPHQSCQLPYFEPFTEYVSNSELELYSALQDWLMEKYATKKITFEACPTSNIYIGRFAHYKQHPIFRWSPPDLNWLNHGERFNRYGLRKSVMFVCVNTDDSALMPTTLANEHRILEKTAIDEYGIGTLQAQQWIERIRMIGVETFQTNHLAWSATKNKI